MHPHLASTIMMQKESNEDPLDVLGCGSGLANCKLTRGLFASNKSALKALSFIVLIVYGKGGGGHRESFN